MYLIRYDHSMIKGPFTEDFKGTTSDVPPRRNSLEKEQNINVITEKRLPCIHQQKEKDTVLIVKYSSPTNSDLKLKGT